VFAHHGGQAEQAFNVEHSMREFSSEFWLASRGMPEAQDLNALFGFVHAIENFERPDR
jgi:hypothetical protein